MKMSYKKEGQNGSYFIFCSHLHFYNKMQITIASILTAATALASVVSAAPKGKAFDRYIQIWFENQVR